MRAINFIKNIFLLVIFLCALVVPVGVSAVEINDNGLIDYSGGSFYSDNTWQNTDGKARNTLYSNNESETGYWVDNNKVNVLGNKIKAAGSNFDVSKLSQNNTYSINTINNSSFYYDPTPDNKNNNDALLLAVATNKGQLYIPPTPILKESKSTDDFLNRVDVKQGLTPGTTVNAKNRYYDLKKQQEKISADVVTVYQQINALEEQLQNPQLDAGTRASINKSIDELKKTRTTLEEQNTTVSTQIDLEKQRRGSTGIIEDQTCDSILDLTSSFCLLTVISKVTNVIFKLTSFIAYLAGTLFDYSLEFSINSSEFFKKLGVVEITWSFIRDILNMTFIFILLWTAIQILISNDAKYNAKKILINVIVVAILMNFSLFAAKLMVDASNVVSLKIYEAMKANTGNKGSSISVRVMDTVGLTTLYNVSEIFNEKTFQAEGTCAKNPGAMITISVMGSIFLIVLILALGLAAILFLIRLVNIIFLFIKSPLWVWGYVIPGNPMMEKLKNNWQADMKHVTLFPILYLFWMLVAVIIFEKLGTVTKTQGDGSGLLGLICNGPNSAGVSDSISLIAIFVIVIIFMMKAVEYGVKHSSDGSGEILGGKLATTVANKFNGYQTAMTKGLLNKAKIGAAAVGGASVGVANRGLVFAKDTTKRTGGALVGGAAGMLNGDGFKKGVGEGFINPGVYRKEQLATLAGKAAMLTGSQTLAAKATKLAEESSKERKDVYETRTKGEKTKEENLQKIAAKAYKIDTQEEWEKKNGEIGNDAAKADKYKEHIEKQIEKRANASLGKNIITRNNKDGIKHLDAIRAKAVSQEVDPTTGKIKIKINNRDIATGLGDVLKYHTTGDGAKVDGVHINKKGAWKPFRTKKAEARIKAAEAAFKAEESKYSGDQAEKDLEAMIKKTETKLSQIPEDAAIDKNIKDVLSGVSVSIDKEILKKHKNLRKLNDLFNEYNRASATRKAEIELELHDEKEKIVTERNKMSEKLIKHKNDLAKKAAAKEKKDKENK